MRQMKQTMAGAVVLLAGFAAAAQMTNGGFGFYESERGPCITPEQRAAIQAKLSASIVALRAAGKLPELQTQVLVAAPKFSWPVQAASNNADPGVHAISNFVDQNTNATSTLDYNCGVRTYDGHHGTDIYTWPFPWWKMDYNEVRAVAGAPGTIIYKNDGSYDRSCVSTGGNWNAVYVQHADGSIAWYGHLKSGSLTTNIVGASVVEGQYLGVVGSSGMSTGPHLHFEVYDATNHLIDPWQGACNALNTNSWWQSQRNYYDSALNKISTHSAPVATPSCPGQETPNTNDVFAPGAAVYFYTFYRDQLVGDVTHHDIVRPNGTFYATWDSTNATYYTSSYWYWWYTTSASDPRGSWYYRVTYKGSNYEHRFYMGSADAALRVTNTTPAAVTGTNLVLNITVTNKTAAYATYLTVTNSLPAGCSFVSALSGGTFGGGVISWGVTGLAANASTQLSFTVLFTNTAPVTALTNSARVATGTFDGVTTNDVASVVIPTDHDGDGIPTALEGAGDSNSNGIPAYLDAGETFKLTAIAAGTLNTWAAYSGAVYQLQYTTNLLPPAVWTNLGGAVTAQSSSISVADTNASAQRTYRAILQRLP